jgi:hypothetical protein
MAPSETASSPGFCFPEGDGHLGLSEQLWIPGCGLQRGFTLLLLISLTNIKQNYFLYLEILSS